MNSNRENARCLNTRIFEKIVKKIFFQFRYRGIFVNRHLLVFLKKKERTKKMPTSGKDLETTGYQAHYTGTIEFGGACNCRAYRARYAARRA